jgi:cyclic lactone autoinducer peptide
MKSIRRIIVKMSGLIAMLALFVGVSSAQAACISWFHQPKIPQDMDRFIK